MSCCTDWPRARAPRLHDLYARKLLRAGWAGELTLQEARYIQQKLQRDRRVQRAWSIQSDRTVPITRIAEQAFPEDRRGAREHIVAERQQGEDRAPSQQSGHRSRATDKKASKAPKAPKEKTSRSARTKRGPQAGKQTRRG